MMQCRTSATSAKGQEASSDVSKVLFHPPNHLVFTADIPCAHTRLCRPIGSLQLFASFLPGPLGETPGVKALSCARLVPLLRAPVGRLGSLREDAAQRSSNRNDLVHHGFPHTQLLKCGNQVACHHVEVRGSQALVPETWREQGGQGGQEVRGGQGGCSSIAAIVGEGGETVV